MLNFRQRVALLSNFPVPYQYWTIIGKCTRGKQIQKQKSARERLAAYPLGSWLLASGLTKNHFMKEQIFKANTLAKDIKATYYFKNKKTAIKDCPRWMHGARRSSPRSR